MQSKLYAVIGNPIDHSLSPFIHQCFAKQCNTLIQYEKILCPKEAFREKVHQFFAEQGQGLNVTLPFKEQAFALAQNKTPRCISAKASNTLWMQEGVLYGDNTDGIGFIRDIHRNGINLTGANILILGAGGASRGILAVLSQMSLNKITVAARNKEQASALAKEFPIEPILFEKIKNDYQLLIHATAARRIQDLPFLPESLWENQPYCYDLNYDRKNPTPFLQRAKEHQCQGSDGLGMLVEQAAESFFLWHRMRPEIDSILRKLREILP